MAATKKGARAWERFPHDADAYECAGATLKKRWPRLHAGDAERFPDAKRVAALVRSKESRALVAGDADPAEVATGVQDAWRAFHRGDFGVAWSEGARLGPPGVVAAVKAAAVYAGALERDAARAEALLLEATALAERATRAAPDYANAHYCHAFALGRYSQRISVLKALGEGLAPRVRRSLERALELEPSHADAHLALGLFHAEIVGKVGALAARLTYGANAAEAERHFERALALSPEAPVGPLEYANGLLALYGTKARARACEFFARAADGTPADAMERLDVERARVALAR
jgi:tetratricopeptide (TPR) repeat protein